VYLQQSGRRQRNVSVHYKARENGCCSASQSQTRHAAQAKKIETGAMVHMVIEIVAMAN